MIDLVFRIEKQWGVFEFEITGINKIDTGEGVKEYIGVRMSVRGSFGDIVIERLDMVKKENFHVIACGLVDMLNNREFARYDLNDIRIYTIPPMHELDINTSDGFDDLFESEYGEDKPVITIAIILDRDEEYDRIYPFNEFIPNLQIALEDDDSVEFAEYLKETYGTL